MKKGILILWLLLFGMQDGEARYQDVDSKDNIATLLQEAFLSGPFIGDIKWVGCMDEALRLSRNGQDELFLRT